MRTHSLALADFLGPLNVVVPLPSKLGTDTVTWLLFETSKDPIFVVSTLAGLKSYLKG